MRFAGFLAVAAVALSACGYKGPLYLPQEQPVEPKQSRPAPQQPETGAQSDTKDTQ